VTGLLVGVAIVQLVMLAGGLLWMAVLHEKAGNAKRDLAHHRGMLDAMAGTPRDPFIHDDAWTVAYRDGYDRVERQRRTER
jgi:hypothetical protein